MNKKCFIVVNMSDHHTEITVDNCYIFNKDVSLFLII